jgi:hypothetical protein
MPSSVAVVKAGLYQYLRATAGLGEADGVTVRSAAIIDDPAPRAIVLGGVTMTKAQAGPLAGRAETPTMTCGARAIAPGTNEDAIHAAREGADALLDLVERALLADPTCAKTVPPPGQLTVTAGGLTESPGESSGGGDRRAERAFSITWTSHI